MSFSACPSGSNDWILRKSIQTGLSDGNSFFTVHGYLYNHGEDIVFTKISFRSLIGRLPLAMGVLPLAFALSCASGGEKKGAESLDDVKVKLRRIEVSSATFQQMELKVVAVIENASSSDIQLDGADVSIAILGKGEVIDPSDADGEVLEAEAKMPQNEATPDELAPIDAEQIATGDRYEGTGPSGVIPANANTEISIPVTLPLPSDPAVLNEFLEWHIVDMDIKGQVVLGSRTETFAGSRQVAAPVLPRVVMEEAQVASENAGRQGAAFFTLGIDNPNAFEVTVDEFAWGVMIGEVQMTEPNKSVTEIVPSNSVASFEDTIQMTPDTYGPEVQALLRQNRVPYVVTGHTLVKGIRHPFRFVGEMEFAR
jgi:LEA14-like dessication related protein